MGKETKIAWTDATFSPWRGCTKISEGCAHCYAEGWAKRTGKRIWGHDAAREHGSRSYWKQPEQWNEAAARTGKPFRVFCGSLMDVCEDRPDLLKPRERLMQLIEMTPALTWLLCTKRPHNYERLFTWIWKTGSWPRNVWALATAENQQQANERIPYLLRLPVGVRGLSVEPQLGPIELDREALSGLDWVIVGGESGPGARAFDHTWAEALYAQCAEARMAFFMKQVGSNPHNNGAKLDQRCLLSRNGDDLDDIPMALRIRQFPSPEVSRVR